MIAVIPRTVVISVVKVDSAGWNKTVTASVLNVSVSSSQLGLQ